MKGKKNWGSIWLCLAAVFLVAAIGVMWYLLRHSGFFAPKAPEQTSEQETVVQGDLPIPELTPPAKADAAESSAQPEEGSAQETIVASDKEIPYESPVDFEALWAVNEDICAWLYIPGANLSLPVLQSPTDNSYYLTRDVQRQSSDSGALFIEDYNHADFEDMCTIIYGHRMYSGEMFGTLQATYSSEDTFAQCRDVMIYLPDREIAYEVFAAVPYDNSHILYYNDFDDQLSYRKFIDSIYSTNGLDATLDPDRKPLYGDKLLILSTCLWGDKNNRYLVLAKERSV